MSPRRQTADVRRAALKYRKRHAKWLKHHRKHKLTPKQKKAVREKVSHGFFKKIAKLREHLNLPGTTESTQLAATTIASILEFSIETDLDQPEKLDAKEFANQILKATPDYAKTDTGLCALQFESWMALEAKEIFCRFVETELDPGEATFIAIFEGQFSPDDWAKLTQETNHFVTLEALIEAGTVDPDSGSVCDVTIVECTPVSKAKAKPNRKDPKADEPSPNDAKNLPESFTTAQLEALPGFHADQALVTHAGLVWEDPNTGQHYTLSGDRWFKEGTLTETASIADSGKWGIQQHESGLTEITLLNPETKDSVTYYLDAPYEDIEQGIASIKAQFPNLAEQDDAIAAFLIQYGLNETSKVLGSTLIESDSSGNDTVSIDPVVSGKGWGHYAERAGIRAGFLASIVAKEKGRRKGHSMLESKRLIKARLATKNYDDVSRFMGRTGDTGGNSAAKESVTEDAKNAQAASVAAHAASQKTVGQNWDATGARKTSAAAHTYSAAGKHTSAAFYHGSAADGHADAAKKSGTTASAADHRAAAALHRTASKLHGEVTESVDEAMHYPVIHRAGLSDGPLIGQGKKTHGEASGSAQNAVDQSKKPEHVPFAGVIKAKDREEAATKLKAGEFTQVHRDLHGIAKKNESVDTVSLDEASWDGEHFHVVAGSGDSLVHLHRHAQTGAPKFYKKGAAPAEFKIKRHWSHRLANQDAAKSRKEHPDARALPTNESVSEAITKAKPAAGAKGGTPLYFIASKSAGGTWTVTDKVGKGLGAAQAALQKLADDESGERDVDQSAFAFVRALDYAEARSKARLGDFADWDGTESAEADLVLNQIVEVAANPHGLATIKVDKAAPANKVGEHLAVTMRHLRGPKHHEAAKVAAQKWAKARGFDHTKVSHGFPEAHGEHHHATTFSFDHKLKESVDEGTMVHVTRMAAGTDPKELETKARAMGAHASYIHRPAHAKKGETKELEPVAHFKKTADANAYHAHVTRAGHTATKKADTHANLGKPTLKETVDYTQPGSKVAAQLLRFSEGNTDLAQAKLELHVQLNGAKLTVETYMALDAARIILGDLSYLPEALVSEVAPPGWSGTVKAMKAHKEISNPFALAWAMKKKGAKAHIKPEEVIATAKATGQTISEATAKAVLEITSLNVPPWDGANEVTTSGTTGGFRQSGSATRPTGGAGVVSDTKGKNKEMVKKALDTVKESEDLDEAAKAKTPPARFGDQVHTIKDPARLKKMHAFAQHMSTASHVTPKGRLHYAKIQTRIAQHAKAAHGLDLDEANPSTYAVLAGVADEIIEAKLKAAKESKTVLVPGADYTLDDVQTYYDMQLVQSIDDDDAREVVMEKFNLKDFGVGPTGLVHSKDFPDEGLKPENPPGADGQPDPMGNGTASADDPEAGAEEPEDDAAVHVHIHKPGSGPLGKKGPGKPAAKTPARALVKPKAAKKPATEAEPVRKDSVWGHMTKEQQRKAQDRDRKVMAAIGAHNKSNPHAPIRRLTPDHPAYKKAWEAKVTEVALIEGVSVHIAGAESYEFSHGHKPRGSGNWLLHVPGHKDGKYDPSKKYSHETDHHDYVNHHGTFSDAKKKAVARAKEIGAPRVRIMESESDDRMVVTKTAQDNQRKVPSSDAKPRKPTTSALFGGTAVESYAHVAHNAQDDLTGKSVSQTHLDAEAKKHGGALNRASVTSPKHQGKHYEYQFPSKEKAARFHSGLATRLHPKSHEQHVHVSESSWSETDAIEETTRTGIPAGAKLISSHDDKPAAMTAAKAHKKANPTHRVLVSSQHFPPITGQAGHSTHQVWAHDKPKTESAPVKVTESKLSDQDLKKYYVPGKSFVMDHVWWTIKGRDLDKDTANIAVSEYALKDGHKPATKTIKHSDIGKNINAGKWGGSTPEKGHIGHKQNVAIRNAFRKKHGRRAVAGHADESVIDDMAKGINPYLVSMVESAVARVKKLGIRHGAACESVARCYEAMADQTTTAQTKTNLATYSYLARSIEPGAKLTESVEPGEPNPIDPVLTWIESEEGQAALALGASKEADVAGEEVARGLALTHLLLDRKHYVVAR